MINRSESELIARERRNQALRRPQSGRGADSHAIERAAARKAQRRPKRSSPLEPTSGAESRPAARGRAQK